MSNTWKSYEEVAKYLLNQFSQEFGLARVEGKQHIHGNRSNTSWEIDAKGIKENNEGFIIVECRKYSSSKQNQEKIGALAYRIIDSGALGGIVVSPLGLQAGAKKVANAENIVEVHLNEGCTPLEFSMNFLNMFMVGMHETIAITDSFEATVHRLCSKCDNQFIVSNNEKECPACSAG